MAKKIARCSRFVLLLTPLALGRKTGNSGSFHCLAYAVKSLYYCVGLPQHTEVVRYFLLLQKLANRRIFRQIRNGGTPSNGRCCRWRRYIGRSCFSPFLSVISILCASSLHHIEGGAKENPNGPNLRIKKGCRVFTTRKDLYVTLDATQAAAVPRDIANDHRFYGYVKAGGNDKWTVEFDALPHGHKLVKNMKRGRLTVHPPGAEEPELDPKHIHNEEEIHEKTKKKGPWTQSVDAFCSHPPDTIASATIFMGKWGPGDSDVQPWTILSDTEHVTESRIVIPERPTLNIDPDKPLEETFFSKFLPDVKGHAAILDDYLDNPQAEYHRTYKARHFKFDDPTNPDRDWKVKQCYLVIVAGATELQNGVENLWKSGMSKGRHSYPDYGQFVDRDEFKCFMSAAVYCWAPRHTWFVDKRDKTWETFQGVVDGYNARRKALFRQPPNGVTLDETMVEWKSKTEQTGGLPNATYEPRKPKDYGTMTHDGTEIYTGINCGHEIVECPEKMRAKKYSGIPISFYDKRDTAGHTAVTLRMVEMFGVREGGWVCGDAWFGSIVTAVELYKRFGVHSTFIIKNNDNWYPRKPLLEILFARHGERVAGHHVVMTANIAGVELFASAYAWSENGITFLLSTCGTTVISNTPYYSKYEDEHGHATKKALPRPRVFEFVFEYLPGVDEFNKEAQHTLNLPSSWPTKCCWTRLLLAIAGHCAVDFHRSMIHERPLQYRAVGVLEFADMVTKNLKRRDRPNENSSSAGLVRITGGDSDSPHKALSPSLAVKGRTVGKARERSCYMCRKYSESPSFTAWECASCGTPLCAVDRTGNDGRAMSCKDEHDHSTETELRCNGHKKPLTFPPRYKIYRQHDALATQPPAPPQPRGMLPVAMPATLHQHQGPPLPCQHYPTPYQYSPLQYSTTPHQQYAQYPQNPQSHYYGYYGPGNPVTNPTPAYEYQWPPEAYVQNQRYPQHQQYQSPTSSPAKKMPRVDNSHESSSSSSSED